MSKDFLIKNRNGAISSLSIASVYVIFIALTLVTGVEISKGYGAVEYFFTAVAFVVIVLDVMDLIKMKRNQLKVSFKEDRVVINSYWFSNKEYKYELMDEIGLAEKDIAFKYDGKTKSIGFLSKSDLIRVMKILKDNCEK